MTNWKRKGIFYYINVNVYSSSGKNLIFTKRIDFVSYQLIKLIHGKQRLDDIAIDSVFKHLDF